MYKYEANIKHKENFPSHANSIVTSKGYGTEAKFLSIAKGMGKMLIENGVEMIEDPFKVESKRRSSKLNEARE